MKNLRSLIKRILPATVFHLVRDIPYILNDLGPGGATDIPIPRIRDQFDGPRGYDVFKRNGLEAFAFYQEAVGITSDTKMLDIGCGIGRKTLPLIKFLDDHGLYVGIDIDDRGIKWCSRNISPRNSRFVFFRLDIYNKYYNPLGKIEASSIVLPFSENGFDLVTLWSVFTHMYARDISRYLEEIARVLKPGGKIAASYYIITQQAAQEIKAGTAAENIVHRLPDGVSSTNNPNIPEDLIAVDEDWLRSAYAKAGLKISKPIYFGAWSNNPVSDKYGNLNRQDIVVAEKI